MKNFKRALSLLLACLLSLSMSAVIAGADNVTFTDVSGHWAWTGGQIPYLVSKNVLNGYKQADGSYTFKPDGEVTRAEFVKMLDETFGLKDTAPIFYADVKDTDWYYPYFQKAAEQGYILNYGSMVDPNGKLTREEATALLVRYLDLSADKAQAPGYFADYSEISENFRAYVLEAAYEGVVDGVMKNGQRMFQPKRVLTRAEALTILFRAAGAIFTGTSKTRDPGAAETNNVFVTGGSTVIQNVNFDGRNIISEGVNSGTLTFTNCKFNGPLTIRGGADVIFYRCTLGEVTVTGGGKVSLLDYTTIGDLYVEKASVINIYSNTRVETLNVLPSASSLTIGGDGSIGHANVQAKGLVSALFPSSYAISPGLTAVFAGTACTGKSDDLDAFTEPPFVFADGNNCAVAVKPVASGVVYGYFSNSDIPPAVFAFDAEYERSNYTVRFNAESGVWSYTSPHTLSAVSNFSYLVLQLRQDTKLYRPVVVKCAFAVDNGISSGPDVTSDTLAFLAKSNGSAQWFYTDSGAKLNQAEFLAGYDRTDSALRSLGNVSNLNRYNITINSRYAENYGYLALMLTDSDGVHMIPEILSVGRTGFSAGPEIKTAGVIRYTASEPGDLYYYLTSEPTPPAPEKFSAEYNAATVYGKETVRANYSSEFKFDTSLVSRYPYMVICLRTSGGDYRQPVVLNVDISTGFATDPALRGEGEIRFYTDKGGSVKYYYTASSSAPSSEEFSEAYSRAESRLKGSMSVGPNQFYTISYLAQYSATRPYMAIMFTDQSGTDYSPVLVELALALDNGFATQPYVSDGKIWFSTRADGKVFLFYTTDDTAWAADDFYWEYQSSGTYRDVADPVTANQLTSITIDEKAYKRNRYAVLAFLPEGSQLNGRDWSNPYVLDIAGSEYDTIGSGLSITVNKDDRTVTLMSSYNGTLYYYFTDSDRNLPLAASFESCYNSADRFDRIEISSGMPKTVNVGSYKYAVFSILVDGRYLSPVTADLTTGSQYSTGLDDGATAKGTGFNSVRMPNTGSVIFETKVAGTVTILNAREGFLTSTGISTHVNANEAASLDLPELNDILAILLGGSTYYIQLTADNGDVYEAYRLMTFNN